MKKKLILGLAIMIAIGEVAMADGYWECVGDSTKEGIIGAKKAYDDYNLDIVVDAASNATGVNSKIVEGAGYAAGAIGGFTAGVLNCD